jgi:hypothetical protein
MSITVFTKETLIFSLEMTINQRLPNGYVPAAARPELIATQKAA